MTPDRSGREGKLPADGDAPVLVAVLNNREDMRRVREEGWYRIPLGRAPTPLAAHYLALYLTAAFGPERWSVRYLAEIESCEVRSRRELIPAEANHPRAQDLYLCLRLGPLQELQRPVPARALRRVAFIPTTLQRLLQAEDVRDLWGTAHEGARRRPGVVQR
ncbi:MAG: hypothetical protein HPY83_08700 [Anaerolineae bacterium]|nr:hypothetical protein [Anaerolineae bacterium]